MSHNCVHGCRGFGQWHDDVELTECECCKRAFCRDCKGKYLGIVMDEDGSFCRYCIRGPKQLFETKEVMWHLAINPPMTPEETKAVLHLLLDDDLGGALDHLLKARHATREEVEAQMRDTTNPPDDFRSNDEESAYQEKELKHRQQRIANGEPPWSPCGSDDDEPPAKRQAL